MKKANYWEVKRKVEMLKKLSSSKAQPDKYYQILRSAFTGVRTSAITIQNDVIYRSRWNKKGMLFSHASELSYPKHIYVKRKGRLNNIGESILYAASSELGTIIESRPDINKLFTIIKIQAENSNLFFYPLGITDQGYYSQKTSTAEKLIVEYVNSEITKIVNHPEEYNSTIALSQLYLRSGLIGSDNPGSIIYPSVESGKISNKTTYNLAILPNIFDKCFSIAEATVYCLSNLQKHIQLTPLNKTENITNSGDLNWTFSYNEMTQRINNGLTLDGSYCEEVKCIEL